MTAAERLYWNHDRTKLVPDGKEAAFLAFPVGAKIPDAVVSKYGLATAPPKELMPEPPGDAVENLSDRQAKPSRKRSRQDP